MALKFEFRLAVILLLLAAAASTAAVQVQRTTYDPARQGQSGGPTKSFVDSTLGRINPSDKDYGQCIAEGRKLLLDETLKNGYFWSNVVSLALLGCLFIVVIYQHKIQTKREWAAAEIIAEYQHALARANAQIDEATERNSALMEAINTLKEAALRSPFLPPQVPASAISSVKRITSKSTVADIVVPSANGETKAGNGNSRVRTASPDSTNQMGLFKREVDLVMQVNSLEQQLIRSNEEKQHLRRQLSDSDRRLQDEQQKNRTLKSG